MRVGDRVEVTKRFVDEDIVGCEGVITEAREDQFVEVVLDGLAQTWYFTEDEIRPANDEEDYCSWCGGACDCD